MDDPVPPTTQSRLSWTVWPLRQDPLRASAVGLLILGFSAYCLFAFNHWLYGAAALVILAIGAQSALLPSRYAIEPEGIRLVHLTGGRFVPWESLACYLRTDELIALSTTNPPTQRSIADGMIVRPAGNGDEVLAALAVHLPEYSRASRGNDQGDADGPDSDSG